MDIEDWEILPHGGGFIDYHEGEENNYSSNSNPKSKFNMNYFVCPPSPPRMLIQPNRVVPVPFQLEPASQKEVQIEGLPSRGPDLVSEEPDQDPISQVFFKKLKENEVFVDMKMDSPKSPKKGLIVDAFQDKGEILDTPRIKNDRADEDEGEKGLNLWKWSLSGIGAIWSFGFAAATVCVIIFGSQQRIKLHDHKHKYRFQIYADDKRIEQVVHNATKMNETVPIGRAHITYGGYYEGLPTTCISPTNV